MRSLKSKPIVSISIVAVNVIVFIICTINGAFLYSKGSLNAFDVLVQGEYGRIFWSMFLHSGRSHLFNNMLLLFFLGAMIEKEAGHVRYAVLYFLSGIGGNLLSLYVKVISNDLSGSIGASGAIFGLDGALLAMVLFSGRRIENLSPPRVLFMIAYSLYNGFVAAGVLCILQKWKDRRISESNREVWF